MSSAPDRLALALAGASALASGVAAAHQVLGLPGIPAPWGLAPAGGLFLAALVAARHRRRAPIAPEDPFAFLDAVQVDRRLPAPPPTPPRTPPASPPARRLRAWPVIRGILATIGGITVATVVLLVVNAVVVPKLSKLFGAHPSCNGGHWGGTAQEVYVPHPTHTRVLKTFAPVDDADL